MRIGDVLYFSPRYRFSDLDFGKSDVVAHAFQDRVEGFYFQPAARLLQSGDAFAAGLVMCAGVEFIAAAWGKQEPEEWLKNNLQEFAIDASLADQFWRNFRHGLAHEGRIKSFGQFSLELPEAVVRASDIVIVNPKLLLNAVTEAFRKQCANASTGRRKVLAQNLRRYFDAEVKVANR